MIFVLQNSCINQLNHNIYNGYLWQHNLTAVNPHHACNEIILKHRPTEMCSQHAWNIKTVYVKWFYTTTLLTQDQSTVLLKPVCNTALVS